ncbi:MAG: hypothetical protein R3E79_06115 [Caldilineaceae bacterium]
MRKPSIQLAEGAGQPLVIPPFIIVIVGVPLLLLMLYITVLDLQAMVGHINQLADLHLTADMRVTLDIEIAAEAIKVLLDLYLLIVLTLLTITGLRLLYANKSKLGEVWFLELVPCLFLARTMTGVRRWLVGIILVRLTLRLIQQTLRVEYQPTTDVTYLAILIALLIGAWVLSFRQQTTMC